MSPSIIIVANKWWEAAPLVAILQHANSRQSDFSAAPHEIVNASQPGPGGPSLVSPRLMVRCNGIDVEIWCVQDLMEPAENSSSTWEKARVLPRVIRPNGRQPLVIAFGTAANPQSSDGNGTVVIGTSVFVHDPFTTPPDSQKHWTDRRLNQIVPSDAQQLLERLPLQFVNEAEKRLLAPPNAPAAPPRIKVASNLVSVGVVNVTNSTDYDWADKQAIARFEDGMGSAHIASVETTHGVIRLVLEAPFLYISGLANAVGLFPEQVSPNRYSQNFVAAHNAAIALAWLLPELAVALPP